MKVGVYLGDFTPESGGGYTFQDDVFAALCDLTGETKHTFHLIYRGYISEEMRSRVAMAGIHLSPMIANRIANSGLVQSLMWLRRIGRKFVKPADVYTQAMRNQGLEFIWYLSEHAVAVDIPYLCTVWDLQHRRQPWFPEMSVQGEWQKREDYYKQLLPRASFVITGVETGKEEIMRFYGLLSERIRLLPHPTPSFALDAKQTSNPGILDIYQLPSRFFLYPAQYWPHKNHSVIVKALAHLKTEQNFRSEVVFVGSDKGNQNYISELASFLGVSDQIHMLGFIPREVLLELYKKSIALLYMSLCGPENLPPLEAFALGCPVVASKIAGSEEQLGDAAIQVNPCDYLSVADAIKTLSENSELREQLISRGRQRAQQWTAKDYVRGIFSLLDEFEPVRQTWRL